MRVLIVGCGYVGLPLGAELARRGHHVFGLRRSADDGRQLTAAGITPLQADITRMADLEKLPSGFDWVVNSVASSHGGPDDYRAVYLDGTRNLLDWLQPAPPARFVYTSSTSVYAQDDGSWVTEESAAEPSSATSRVLVETERLLLGAARGFAAIILRVAGIYGPGRGYWLQQLLRGEAAIEETGERFLNMIHRDDVVRAIVSALEGGQTGGIYNACDDEPVPQRVLLDWLAERLECPLASGTGTSALAPRKRGATNKRVSNRKLRLELGCEFKYPTFRQGYLAEIARLEAAGQLHAGKARVPR